MCASVKTRRRPRLLAGSTESLRPSPISDTHARACNIDRRQLSPCTAPRSRATTPRSTCSHDSFRHSSVHAPCRRSQRQQMSQARGWPRNKVRSPWSSSPRAHRALVGCGLGPEPDCRASHNILRRFRRERLSLLPRPHPLADPWGGGSVTIVSGPVRGASDSGADRLIQPVLERAGATP
jgi:hypothetical protein